MRRLRRTDRRQVGLTPAQPGKASVFFEPAGPRVLAHRGFSLEAPENTMLAFAKALALGVTHIETDVHASLDQVAVISHDPDLARVAGRDVRVGQLKVSELRRIELGSGQSFASLAEALDAFPDARFNIDIKSDDAVGPTVEAIRSVGATHRVLVTSFSDSRRLSAVNQLPGVATSAAARSSANLLAAGTFRLSGQVRKLLSSVDAVQLPERWKGVRVITPRLIRQAQAAGVEVHVWTVNDPEDMARLLDWGVDGLVTDRSDLALSLLQSRA